EHAVELVAGHALFAGAQQVRRQNPFMEGNLGTFKYGAHGDGELRTAVPAEQQARTVRFALKAAIALYAAAMRANRAFRPAQALKVLSGGGFVVEAFGGEIHVRLPIWPVFWPLDLRLSSI